jgi:hypothetical protein
MAMSDPDASKVSIGAPRSRIDRAKDAGLTRGLYQGSRTIRRVRGWLRTSERARTIGRLVQPQLERDLFLTEAVGRCTGKMASARRRPLQFMLPHLCSLSPRSAHCSRARGWRARHAAPCVLFQSRAPLHCVGTSSFGGRGNHGFQRRQRRVGMHQATDLSDEGSSRVPRRSRRRASLVECRGALGNEPPRRTARAIP